VSVFELNRTLLIWLGWDEKLQITEIPFFIPCSWKGLELGFGEQAGDLEDPSIHSNRSYNDETQGCPEL